MCARKRNELKHETGTPREAKHKAALPLTQQHLQMARFITCESITLILKNSYSLALSSSWHSYKYQMMDMWLKLTTYHKVSNGKVYIADTAKILLLVTTAFSIYFLTALWDSEFFQLLTTQPVDSQHKKVGMPLKIWEKEIFPYKCFRICSTKERILIINFTFSNEKLYIFYT